MQFIKAGIYGLCVADALGVPAESCSREYLKENPLVNMTSGGIRGQNAGCWSDDSSMTLCLADSIGQVGYFHTHDIMQRFHLWFTEGAYTPEGVCFDYGITTGRAIRRYQKGVTPALCGSNKVNENGNGSLMRILPAAFVLYGKYGMDITKSTRAMEEIHKLSALTHRHPIAMSGCGIYVAIAARLLGGQPMYQAALEGINAALEWYGRHRKFYDAIGSWKRIANLRQLMCEDEDGIISGGYVVSTLEAALWCLLNTNSYRECVLKAVNLGRDTDTIAAVAGGLAGIYYGFESIPEEWINDLKGKDVIDRCIAGLEAYCMEHNEFPFKTNELTAADSYKAVRASRSGDIAFSTPLSGRKTGKILDKFRGCLIGGAAGDALGYTVEFMSEPVIFRKFGVGGIQAYALRDGIAQISDDTQMTMFTANGLLYADAHGDLTSCCRHIADSYREWFKTQVTSKPVKKGYYHNWLMNLPQMYARRAPGNTCMSAIDGGCVGSVEYPDNNSKGCGGVMRVAPIGLYLGTAGLSPFAVDMVGADAAALTHGHQMGYIPAAMLVHIIALLANSEDISVVEAVEDSIYAMERTFGRAEHLPAFLAQIRKAVTLAQEGTRDLDAIHALGPGWCGDDALAVAVFCAVKYSDDFHKAMVASVNHDGDSDSTGAITGNILGAALGYSRIPDHYKENIEHHDVLMVLADDLFHGCPRDAEKQQRWDEKYVFVTYGKESEPEERKMTDIHMHLIYGVDDGAMDESMSLSMVLQAYEQGVRCIFATPHSSAYAADRKMCLHRFHKLQKRVTQLLPDMTLHLGCEVLCDSHMMAAALEGLSTGQIPTLNGSKFVLAEFSQWVRRENALSYVRKLTEAGWRPVIAHMERYTYLQEDMELVAAFRDMGCLLQVNAYSLENESDRKIKDWARRLVKEKLVDFLGTDAHRTNHRPPVVEEGVAWVYANCPKAYADAIAWKNAKDYLIG